MGKQKNIQALQLEEHETFIESGRLDACFDQLIKGLVMFLTVVGIPYTMYLLFQLLLSL
ncbi:MAG: DUF3930 family protein [Ectobacillus sp.]